MLSSPVTDVDLGSKQRRSTSARDRAEPVPQDVHRLPGHLIRRAQQAHNRMWVNEVSGEITSPQYGILNAILGYPGIDQKSVGEEVGIDKSTVGDVIDRLIEKRLVVAYRDPDDQRRNLLHLSKAGKRAVSDLAPRVLEMNRKLVRALDEREQQRLVMLLEALVDSIPDNGPS
jgi:DNA-binding MarR family transcriptional regulator